MYYGASVTYCCGADNQELKGLEQQFMVSYELGHFPVSCVVYWSRKPKAVTPLPCLLICLG
jgi:hypothetical protein